MKANYVIKPNQQYQNASPGKDSQPGNLSPARDSPSKPEGQIRYMVLDNSAIAPSAAKMGAARTYELLNLKEKSRRHIQDRLQALSPQISEANLQPSVTDSLKTAAFPTPSTIKYRSPPNFASPQGTIYDK
jgi:hypothetical protein